MVDDDPIARRLAFLRDMMRYTAEAKERAERLQRETAEQLERSRRAIEASRAFRVNEPKGPAEG